MPAAPPITPSRKRNYWQINDGNRLSVRYIFFDNFINNNIGGGLNSVSTTIDGLRPGEAVFGRPTGAGNRVRVEATAEPGP